MRTREGGRIVVDEAVVIARVRAGEPEAYAELVRAHTGIAIRAAKALGAGADAEDVVQQAFIKAYCSLGRFRDGAAFKPWLLSIVANETRNTVRTAVRQRTLAGREAALVEAEPLIPESADPAHAALEIERRVALLAALDQLSEDHRLVVTYRYLLEMDEPETAQALGWPRGTVKSRLNRALRKLGRLLPDFEPRGGGGPREGEPEREESRGRMESGEGERSRDRQESREGGDEHG
ncbi:RNA polymerase sigma factor [Streptomyces sp. NBC_00038]|uniref:RNA polymerase sigma factor n=1 Tax=Streptomyces sp. NBC_00038 TaxID=2903615 RepID=UPI002253501A|nr:sigma-70 family RNA polymerase sigma factor [Streptomyces sp. NBC_00038]MCX5560182.1 sigma-70 family RNA polymerase sigma factor [Streptomyces sp. NBC_00038]